MSSSSKRHSRDDVSSEEESSGDEEQQQPPPADQATRLEQLKREKRLAMNRESARVRRRRKKMRLETLEQQAEEVGRKNHDLMLTNQSLKTQVAQLESELASAEAASRAAIGIGGMPTEPSGVARAASANLGLAAEQRAALALQQQAAVGGASVASSQTAFGGPSLSMAGMGVSDPEMQYLQMQQQLLSSQSPGSRAGVADGGPSRSPGASAAARLIALEDMQRRTSLAALRGGIGSGGGQILEMDRLNQQLPGFRRLDELSRIRGTEGLRGPNIMDLALRDQSNASQAVGPASRRDLKSEPYDRLADTNKKFH